MRIQYHYLTDLDMNTISSAKLPLNKKWKENVKGFFIQSYGDGSHDVILEKSLGSFQMQGTFLKGISKDNHFTITGFRILHLSDTVRIHMKTSKAAHSIDSAKNLYRLLLPFMIEGVKQ